MVAYTCRYSSGPLIPNSATTTAWNIGINCPLEYLQVLATTFVSSLLFMWSPLTVKLQISLILVCLLFWKHNNYGWLIRAHHFKRKKGYCVPKRLIIGTFISQWALYSAIFCPLLGSANRKMNLREIISLDAHPTIPLLDPPENWSCDCFLGIEINFNLSHDVAFL